MAIGLASRLDYIILNATILIISLGNNFLAEQ